MILNLITILLLSNALSSNKSKSILYTRSVILVLFSINYIFISYTQIEMYTFLGHFIYIVTGCVFYLSLFEPKYLVYIITSCKHVPAKLFKCALDLLVTFISLLHNIVRFAF